MTQRKLGLFGILLSVALLIIGREATIPLFVAVLSLALIFE